MIFFPSFVVTSSGAEVDVEVDVDDVDTVVFVFEVDVDVDVEDPDRLELVLVEVNVNNHYVTMCWKCSEAYVVECRLGDVLDDADEAAVNLIRCKSW
eukprot:6174314-Amphidinium_carterae.1